MNNQKTIEETEEMIDVALHTVLQAINEFDLPYDLKMKVLRSANVVIISPHPMSIERKQNIFAREYKSSLFDLERLERAKTPATRAIAYSD
jgi:hypothetical protein